jgi:hypothetical protein
VGGSALGAAEYLPRCAMTRRTFWELVTVGLIIIIIIMMFDATFVLLLLWLRYMAAF